MAKNEPQGVAIMQMDDKDKQEKSPFSEGFDKGHKAPEGEPKPNANDARVGSLLLAIDDYIEKQRGKRK